MLVYLDMNDRRIGIKVVKALRAQGHKVHWTLVDGYECKLPPGQKIDLAIANSCLRRSPQTGRPISDLPRFADSEAVPYISCNNMEHSGEHDVKNGAYLWIPPEALAEAITSGALDCAASLSWIPGSAARRELDGEGRLISANDGYGWVVTEKEGHHPAWVSLASYLRAEYENLMLPSHQLKTVGWLAEDIPEPHYSNLAKLVLGVTAARKGKRIKIEQIRTSGDRLIASYSRGRPYERLRFRGREVTFEKVTTSSSWWTTALNRVWGHKQTHSQ